MHGITTHGYPGTLRVDIYPKITTRLSEEDIPSLQRNVYDKINGALENDPQQKAIEAIAVWKKIKKIS